MRPEFDNEIDSVLRGHARRGGARPAAWDAVARPSISDEARSGSHLDADEIAAFGEDALTAAARARYSAHLADCDDCRRSVTQVAFAAGVADRINERVGAASAGVGRADEHARAAAATYGTPSPTVATQSPAAANQSPSWRERLASIFSPRAWRYAMPAVALLAVGVVALVTMRNVSREGATMDARRDGGAAQRASAPAAPEAPEAHHADAKQQQTGVLAEAQQGNAGTASGVAPANEQSGEGAQREELAKLRAKGVGGVDQAATGGAAAPVAASQEAVQVTSAEPARPTTGNYVAAAQPSALPPAPAAPRAMVLRDGVPPPTPEATPAPVQPETRGRAAEEARAVPRDEAPSTKRHGPQRGIGGRTGELAASAADAPKDDRAMSRRARGPANNAANNRNDPDESKAKREEDRERQRQQRAETRSVGGRQFRREGDAWIDTAYRSGQATVSMRRGSEQYRALVADAPEIDRISRALGGEVVVLWKGRAYRVKP